MVVLVVLGSTLRLVHLSRGDDSLEIQARGPQEACATGERRVYSPSSVSRLECAQLRRGSLLRVT